MFSQTIAPLTRVAEAWFLTVRVHAPLLFLAEHILATVKVFGCRAFGSAASARPGCSKDAALVLAIDTGEARYVPIGKAIAAGDASRPPGQTPHPDAAIATMNLQAWEHRTRRVRIVFEGARFLVRIALYGTPASVPSLCPLTLTGIHDPRLFQVGSSACSDTCAAKLCSWAEQVVRVLC